MLVVVADTSPLRYLVQIGHVDLLRELFQTICVPTVVSRELSDSSAPTAVQAWISAPPSWLRVLDAPSDEDPALEALDPGERGAIALALSIKANIILIDER